LSQTFIILVIFVIPAQAGIQRFYSTCLWVLSLLRKEFFYCLDSGLRRNDGLVGYPN